MAFTRKEIYDRIASKKMSIEEGVNLLKHIDKHRVKKGKKKHPKGQPENPKLFLEAVEQDLIRIFYEMSHFEFSRISPDLNFFAIGFDSYSLIMINQRLEDMLDMDFNPNLLFDHPSIHQLAIYLVDKYGTGYPVSLHPVEDEEPAVVEPVKRKSESGIVTRFGKQGDVEESGKKSGGKGIVEERVPESIKVKAEGKKEKKAEKPGLEKKVGDVEAVERWLSELISQTAKIPLNKITPTRGFFDMGMESIHLMDIVKKLEEIMHVELYPTLLFEHTTIRELAGYLTNEHGNAIPVKQSSDGKVTEKQVPNVKKSTDTQNSYEQAVERGLADLISLTAKIPLNKISPSRGFFDMGMESVHLMNIVKKLEEIMHVELYPTLLFEHTTIHELAGYLVSEHGQAYPVEFNNEENAPEEKQTFREIKSQPEKPVQKSNHRDEQDIAIIGLAGKYPMAEDVEEFWENLKAGKDCVTEVPKDRWDWQEFYDPDPEKAKDGKIYCKEGAFISDVDKFDPLFFGISPREAELMDPQERWFLQICWKTIEDAGYTLESLGKNVGVFAGVTTNTYLLFGPYEWMKDNYVVPKTYPWSIPNRVSFCLNLTGPSVPFDTACSSSLTAIHYACESLKNRECETALAGGVNFYLHYSKFLMLCQNKMLSPDGRCFTFGSKANGFGPGEGVGAVLLKPLEKAVADNDHIYAIIKSTTLNHGGKASGYYVPNPVQQANLIIDALERGNINPETISYIEAHGTGTDLGDPIEIQGLTRAFSKYTSKKQFCAVGSAKANIGHLESGAGIAGLTRILLQMKHKEFVPSIHSEVLNPKINFTATPFYVQQKVEEWKQLEIEVDGKRESVPRRAGLSSFGAGGANGHVIVEEWEGDLSVQNSSNQPNLFILSAKSENQLKEYAREFSKFLNNSEVDLNRLLYTLKTGREAFTYRLAIICRNRHDLNLKLNSYLNDQKSSDLFYGKAEDNMPLIEDILPDPVQIAEQWIKGFSVDWIKKYPIKQQIISIPSYPFQKKSYWVAQKKGKIQAIETNRLHPLILSNISTLKEQIFYNKLTGKEFFLKDHVVNGEKILPGVTYLEMARAALSLALEHDITGLSSIVWMEPVIITGKDKELFISLYPGREIRFQIYSKDKENKKIQHCRGAYSLGAKGEPKLPELIDVQEIKKRCSGHTTGKECYGSFNQQGLEYGAGFQGIKEAFYNSNEVLSEINVPEPVKPVFKDYILHPSILESGLQSIGILNVSKTILYPASLNQIIIHGHLPLPGYVYITLIDSGLKQDNEASKFNITVTDKQGKIGIELREITFRKYKSTGTNKAPGQEITALINDVLEKVKSNKLKPREAAKMMEEMI